MVGAILHVCLVFAMSDYSDNGFKNNDNSNDSLLDELTLFK